MKLEAGGISMAEIVPLVDGLPSDAARLDVRTIGAKTEITVVYSGTRSLKSLGLRIGAIQGVRQYLRNGYTSWDGSYFVDPVAAREISASDQSLVNGHGMTALLPKSGAGATILGFLRHDRYQSKFRFELTGPFAIEAETLIDLVPHAGEVRSETLVVFAGNDVEAALRTWANMVAEALPLPPRLPARRITGWCSWYNLYASLSEPALREHLGAAQRFRDESRAPFDIFLIDDGFTPEMGDWLDLKPGFELDFRFLEEVRAAGFTPGLWIAPFMVGNRSKLFAKHPDWVVKSRQKDIPLAAMTFYGEFRWHKRSEEYYVLDVTHPEAEAYIRKVFRTWRNEWGAGYFKTDFMHLGSMFGPDEAMWHEAGQSRVGIWMRMARLIREEIGDALWLCCGSPLLPPIGFCDAMRVGRDIGVSWTGHHSAESLLRDQSTRSFMNGVFWQADPDCILLRHRFHDLSDEQVRSLGLFAGYAGGVLMTSDNLDEVPAERRAMLAELAGDGTPFQCDFPDLGRSDVAYRLGSAPDGQPRAVGIGDPVLVQRVRRSDGSVLLNVFNTGSEPATRELGGRHLTLAPYQSQLFNEPRHPESDDPAPD